MSIDLKPCPFCGNTPRPNEDGIISCENANCPASVINSTAETWDKRAKTDQPEESVEDVIFRLIGQHGVDAVGAVMKKIEYGLRCLPDPR